MGSALLDTETLDPAACAAEGQYNAAANALPGSLKLQVAERLAAHRDRRRRLPHQPPTQQPAGPSTASRATRIAAAVAERYAQSPSYRAFLAAEAERAIQHAQAAAEVAALNAQAVADAQQQLLASLNGSLSDESAYPTPKEARRQPSHDLTLWPELQLRPPINPGDPTFAAHSRSGMEEVEERTEERLSSPVGSIRSKARIPKTNSSPQASVHASTPATVVAPGLTVRLFEDSAAEMALPLRARSHRTAAPVAAARRSRREEQENAAEARALDEEIAFRHAPVFEEPAGPPMPLPANLIEFPRQLVAHRKARPRCAEGPLREDDANSAGGSQLRIFEVDASHISTTPEVAEEPTPQWTSIWLDAPASASGSTAATGVPTQLPGEQSSLTGAARLAPETWEASHLAQSPELTGNLHPRPQTAGLSRRLMAAAIDGCFILAGFLAFATTFASISLRTMGPATGVRAHLLLARSAAVFAGHASLQPGTALAAVMGAIAFLYLLYQLLFFSLAEATPGMRCARIALCTFSDENPTRRAMRRRILAVFLSACPLGLGFLWAALDEDRLGWHDLISRMYQRSY